MSPPPQGSTQPQQPQQVDAANIRRVQQKWQPATADTLHHGQPQTPQYDPADRTVAPIPAASAPSAYATDTQPAPAVLPVATQPAPVAQPASMAAPQHKTNNTAYAETTPLPPPAPIATRGKNKFGKDQQQPAVVKREETTRQYYGAVPPVAQRSDPPMAVRHTAPVAPVASPQQREVQQPMAAAVTPIGSAPKIATRGLSGFEELFVRGNVRSVAAVTFRGQPRSRANVTSAVTAALLAHPVAFSTIEGGRSVSWQRDVNADGQMCELPHMRFAEEVIAAPERDIAAAALAREMAEVRDASGGIGITLLLKDRFSQAPIAAQTHTASRFDHPRTMVGDETITGQPTHVSHDYLNPGQSAPANERLYTTQYESQAPAATAGSRQAASAWKPAQRADLEPQHASLYPNNQQFGAQQQHASLYPNNDDVSAQQPQHASLYPSNNTTAQSAGAGAGEDGVVGVIFNLNHALLDATGMKQLVQYFIGLVTHDGAGGRMVTPPEVVMEPSVPLNRDTIPGLRGKHVPTHYLPLDPQARKGRHDDLSSESSLSSEDIQRDFGMYRRLSKAEVKQMKKLEKKEEKFAKEEDEHRYQIEKAEYKELKDISKAEFKEFKRIDKLERKEHKIEDKEMKERSKIEYKEAKDQQQIARKALKYHMPGIMAFDYRDRRSQLVEDRAAHGPQPLTEDLQRNDGRHAGGIYFLRTADICGFAPGTDPKLMAAHTKDSMAHENRDLSEGALFTPDVHAMLERQTLDALRSKSRLPINNTSLIAASLAVACVARAHARGVLSQHLMSYDRVGVTISIPLDLRDRSIVNEPEFVMPGGYVDATGPARRLNFLNCFGTVTVGVEFDGHLFRGRTADEFLKQYDVVGLASDILLDIKDRIARGEAHKDALAVAAGKWTDVAPTGTVELCNHGLYRDAPHAEVTLSQSADPRVFADNKALSITAWSSAAQGTTNLAASMCGEIDRREVNSLMYSAMASLAHASLF